MINLLDYTLPELTDWMQNELGEPKFRAAQVWQWIWQKMARDFDAMTNVSKACRERLAQCAEIRWPEIESWTNPTSSSRSSYPTFPTISAHR